MATKDPEVNLTFVPTAAYRNHCLLAPSVGCLGCLFKRVICGPPAEPFSTWMLESSTVMKGQAWKILNAMETNVWDLLHFAYLWI